jgi:hypothetical protein
MIIHTIDKKVVESLAFSCALHGGATENFPGYAARVATRLYGLGGVRHTRWSPSRNFTPNVDRSIGRRHSPQHIVMPRM